MHKIFTYTPTQGFGSNCYLLQSGEAFAIIDPSVSYSEILSKHPQIEDRVKYVLLTHAHFDHILAINSWADIADIYVGEADGPSLSDPYYNCYLGFYGIEDGYYGKYTAVDQSTVLPLGDGTVTVSMCPGHTRGGVSYRFEDSVFIGDTLFEGGGFGRTDLPGGDYQTLQQTLLRIISHERDCTFYPGHGAPTTLRKVLRDFS